MTLRRYLQSRYVRGGRVWPELDCLGLVRLARHEMFGRELMPMCTAAEPGNFREITRAVGEVSGVLDMRECERRPGAVATAWLASLCVHVGIVVEADGRQWILETDTPAGPAMTPISVFEKRYSRVVYYDD